METKPNFVDMMREMADDHLGKADFTKSFEVVVKAVKDHEAKLTADFQDLVAMVNSLSEQVKGHATQTVDELKSQHEQVLAGHTQAVQSKLAEIDSRLADLRDGEDADPEYVINEVLARIPKPEIPQPLSIEDIRNGLEVLQGEDRPKTSVIHGLDETLAALKNDVKAAADRTGWGAHPLAVQGAGSTKVKVARVINFTGATVTQSRDGVTTVAVSATGTVYTETPSGLINGSNKAYTTLNNITTVFSFSINGQYIHPADYSVSGTTITFVTALDASLSGLAFTIVYS